jgi:hypothetical protein
VPSGQQVGDVFLAERCVVARHGCDQEVCRTLQVTDPPRRIRHREAREKVVEIVPVLGDRSWGDGTAEKCGRAEPQPTNGVGEHLAVLVEVGEEPLIDRAQKDGEDSFIGSILTDVERNRSRFSWSGTSFSGDVSARRRRPHRWTLGRA